MSKRKTTGGPSTSKRASKPTWGKHLHLSDVQLDWQAPLFNEKVDALQDPCIFERIVREEDWEEFGVIKKFKNWGWMAALTPLPCKLYDDARKANTYPKLVQEWFATLSRNLGDNPPLTTTLTGLVRGQPATLSMETFNQIAGEVFFDTGVTIPNENYSYPTAIELFENGPGSNDWVTMRDELFVSLQLGDRKGLFKENLIPMARVLITIICQNILPRKSDLQVIRHYEVPLLHALTTGRPALSLHHVIMTNIWETRDLKSRSGALPYVRFLSTFLSAAGVIPGSREPKKEEIRLVKKKVTGLSFSTYNGVCMIEDRAKNLSYTPSDAEEEEETEDEEMEEEEVEEDDDEDMEEDEDYALGARRGMSRQFMREHCRRMEDSTRANWQMQEVYQYYHWQHNEQMRDMQAGQTSVWPNMPAPVSYRPQTPPSANETGPSQYGQPGDPWNMAPLAQGLYDSLFGYYPPPPQ